MTVGRSDGQSTGIGVVSAGLSAVYDALGVGRDEGDEEEADDDDDVTFIGETTTDTEDQGTDDPAEDPFAELDPDALSLPDETDADPSEESAADDGDDISWDDVADSDELAWSDDDDWGFDGDDTEESFSFGGESQPESVRVENDTFGLDDVRCDDPDQHYETAHDEFKAVSEELEFSGTVDDLELDALTLGDSTEDDDMETVDLDELTGEDPERREGTSINSSSERSEPREREEPDEPANDDPDWDPGFDGDGPDMEGFNFGVEERDGWN
ncbi:hypothetical protein [Haloarchaeobius sp. FL176]|uniref:hypothetical protein n=1 Tax=Haloarchaeobius sp. FL176 TaxID=2967129 RepID=UPI0021483402|nr:hypothetical protein [Haloarchaeobius sp. FL176]